MQFENSLVFVILNTIHNSNTKYKAMYLTKYVQNFMVNVINFY